MCASEILQPLSAIGPVVTVVTTHLGACLVRLGAVLSGIERACRRGLRQEAASVVRAVTIRARLHAGLLDVVRVRVHPVLPDIVDLVRTAIRRVGHRGVANGTLRDLACVTL